LLCSDTNTAGGAGGLEELVPGGNQSSSMILVGTPMSPGMIALFVPYRHSSHGRRIYLFLRKISTILGCYRLVQTLEMSENDGSYRDRVLLRKLIYSCFLQNKTSKELCIKARVKSVCLHST